MAAETTPKISDEKWPRTASLVKAFFEDTSTGRSVPAEFNRKDAYSDLLVEFLRADRIERGRVICSFTVKPAIANVYGGLHGGSVAAIAERVSIACARTVLPKEKEIFLGELSMPYLSSAPNSAEVVVDGSVVRSGRNVTVVSIDFRLKKTEQLVYTARATFFNMPVAKL